MPPPTSSGSLSGVGRVKPLPSGPTTASSSPDVQFAQAPGPRTDILEQELDQPAPRAGA